MVHFAGGSGSLSRWGTMRLTGAQSAVIRTPNCEDIDLPAGVAIDRPDGIVLLNEELFPPATLPRDEDPGLRMADYETTADGSLVYLNERSLLRFGEDLMPIWRVTDDFGGWGIERVSAREIVLVALDEREPVAHQVWSLDDGWRTDVVR